jgi:hypothetical protein
VQVPYVKEVGPLDGELPATIAQQMDKMKLLKDPADRVNFDYVEVRALGIPGAARILWLF